MTAARDEIDAFMCELKATREVIAAGDKVADELADLERCFDHLCTSDVPVAVQACDEIVRAIGETDASMRDRLASLMKILARARDLIMGTAQ